MSENVLCVRLKPCLPRAGQVLQHYSYRGILFKAGAGWVKVADGVAEHLRTVRQQAHDPYSPMAFDVCSEDEARKLDVKDIEQSTEAVPVDRARLQVAREIAPTSNESAGPVATAGVVTEGSKDRPAARAKH